MPYLSGNDGKSRWCSLDASSMPRKAFVRGYETLPHNDKGAIMKHLAKVGPLSITVSATGFQFYKSGVYNGCNYTDQVVLNHGVQLVGYGTDPDHKLGDYWLVRNSWGEHFGEGGYIRIKRQLKPTCGVDPEPSEGTGCSYDGFDLQKVCGSCGILFDAAYPIGTMPSAHIAP